jgi:hypothetical protein
MIYQIRQYDIHPGKMPEWVTLFERHLRPIHDRLGIPIIGAWEPVSGNTFIWIRSFDNEAAIATQEAAYFASPERQALGSQPQALILATRIELMRSTRSA